MSKQDTTMKNNLSKDLPEPLSVITAKNIQKNYNLKGGFIFKALRGINLTVNKGEVFTIVGHNGAGKSTFIKIIMGLTNPTGGDISILNTDTALNLPKNIKAKIGYIPETVNFYGNLTGMETMKFFGKLNGVYDEKLFAGLLESVGILKAADKKVIAYSKGMRQRLAFAVSQIKNPDIFIFDEPTSGMDPSGINEFVLLVKSLHKEGKTIIMTSHILPEVEDISDRICIMMNGEVTALGGINDLIEKAGLTTFINLRFKDGYVPEITTLEDMKAESLLIDFSKSEINSEINIGFLEKNRIKLLDKIISKYENMLEDLNIKKPGLFEIYKHFSVKRGTND
ncbi:MAG: ABC transporter ATP-binding protein [bacterium]|jgi:ABC-type multidrug transport system ATPase subunit